MRRTRSGWNGSRSPPNTRRTYRVQVERFCAYLTTSLRDAGGPLRDAGGPLRERHAAAYAVRDYRTWLKTVCRAKPSSVNLTLAALDHFYRFLGLDRPNVAREDLPRAPPCALERDEQIAFLRAVERCPSVRDCAIAHLLFYTSTRAIQIRRDCLCLNRFDQSLLRVRLQLTLIWIVLKRCSTVISPRTIALF